MRLYVVSSPVNVQHARYLRRAKGCILLPLKQEKRNRNSSVDIASWGCGQEPMGSVLVRSRSWRWGVMGISPDPSDFYLFNRPLNDPFVVVVISFFFFFWSVYLITTIWHELLLVLRISLHWCNDIKDFLNVQPSLHFTAYEDLWILLLLNGTRSCLKSQCVQAEMLLNHFKTYVWYISQYQIYTDR